NGANKRMGCCIAKVINAKVNPYHLLRPGNFQFYCTYTLTVAFKWIIQIRFGNMQSGIFTIKKITHN
ncbi:MAG TPA: hypothetical protein DCM62_01190, partial [Bacteroidales bacterium]|nr:hypothetical protein [Bacteroidales bacterium]